MKDLSIVDHYDGMDIDELEFELEDLNNVIHREKDRLSHTCSPVRIEKHFDAIYKLEAEADYVRKRIKELMDE